MKAEQDEKENRKCWQN